MELKRNWREKWAGQNKAAPQKLFEHVEASRVKCTLNFINLKTLQNPQERV